MPRWQPMVIAIALTALFTAPSCIAIQQLAALHAVTFAFAGLSDVRVAGVRIGPEASLSTLTISEAARVGAAVATGDVPLEMIAHVSARNPPANTVSARMVDLGWTLFIGGRQSLAGRLQSPVELTPGRAVDVPLSVRLNLLEFGSGGARDLYELALAIAGQGQLQKDLRLELVPAIQTSLGPIQYPVPVVVRRGATTP